MRYDNIHKLLYRFRRHLWLQSLVNRMWFGLLVSSGILALAAVFHTLHQPVEVKWWVAAALFPLVAVALIVMFKRPSLAAAASSADHWLNTHELFATAWYLGSQSTAASSTALVVLGQAEQKASNGSVNLPRIYKTPDTVPLVGVIALVATSIFFLLLQGAASDIKIVNPMPDKKLLQAQTDAALVSSVLDPLFPDAYPSNVEEPSMPKRTNISTGLAERSTFLEPPVTEQNAQSNPGTNKRSITPQASTGAGAGQVASSQPSGNTRDPDTPEKLDILDDPVYVAVQRKPASDTVSTDKKVSVELIPFESSPSQSHDSGQEPPASQVATMTFSDRVGPAQKALQVRYFEETTDVN